MVSKNLAAFKPGGKQFLLSNRYSWLIWVLIIIIVVVPRVFGLDVFYARDELAIWPWADEFALAIWEGDLVGTLTASDYPGIPMFWAQTLFLTIKYSFPSLFPQTRLPLDMLFQERGLDLLAERRLVAALLVSLQVIGACWLVRRLFGWKVALLAAIFMGLDPFGLSEARLLRLEMVSALFVCLSLLAYFLYLRRRRRSWLLLSGVMAGLGVSSKTSAGLMVPYIWLLLLLDFFLAKQPFASEDAHSSTTGQQPFASEDAHSSTGQAECSGFEVGQTWPGRFKQMVVNGLIWAAGAVGAFWLVWPAMWVRPFAAIRHVFIQGLSQAAEESVWHGAVFFWGRIFQDDPGPFFYPVVFVFRTTPLTWIGLLSALILGLIFWQQVTSTQTTEVVTTKKAGTGTQKAGTGPLSVSEQNHSEQPQPTGHGPQLWQFPWPGVAVSLLLVYVVIMAIELTFVVSKVDRFLLIVFPALNILSAIGIAALIQWLVERIAHLLTMSHTTGHMQQTRNTQYGIRNWLSISLIIIILGIQLAITLPAYPYFFTYWNPWVGGGRGAMATLPMGSGEGIDLAMDYLNNRPGAAESTLVCGASQPWCSRLFKGETLRYASFFNGTWVEADYASLYISHLQRQNYPPEIVDFFRQQAPLYQVDLQGATYVWVYAVPEIKHFAGAQNDLVGLGRLLGYNLSPVPSASEGIAGQAGQTIEAIVWWTNWGAGLDSLVLRLLDETGYEWGRASVVPLSEYASIPPEQRAIVSGTATLTIPPGIPPGLYFLRIGVVKPETGRLLGEFKMPGQASKLVVKPGTIFTNPTLFSISNPVNRRLAPDIALLGYTPPEQVLTADLPTWLTLYWQATASPSNYLVMLRLLDSAGQEVTRWQGQPGHGHYPTENWQSGEIVRDAWALQVKPETPVGLYSLEISLLNADDPEIENHKPAGQLFKIENLEVWPQPISYEIPDMQTELRLNFGDRLTLLGYDLYFEADGVGGGALSPVFYWQSQGELQEAFDLLLTLRAADTNQVIKEWQVPLGTDTAKAFWKAGEVINTIYRFEAGALVGGRYHLDIVLQNRTLERTEPVKPDESPETTFARIENIQDKIVVRVGTSE